MGWLASLAGLLAGLARLAGLGWLAGPARLAGLAGLAGLTGLAGWAGLTAGGAHPGDVPGAQNSSPEVSLPVRHTMGTSKRSKGSSREVLLQVRLALGTSQGIQKVPQRGFTASETHHGDVQEVQKGAPNRSTCH